MVFLIHSRFDCQTSIGQVYDKEKKFLKDNGYNPFWLIT